MWRASLLVAALATTALADDEPHAQRDELAKVPARAKAPKLDPHAMLAGQIHDESAAIDRARATVTDKLATADSVRAKRVRAASRMLRARLPDTATPEERLEAARRLAAARLLLERDTGERGLLADELAHLQTAAKRTAGEADEVAAIVLPTELVWPARGSIARHFGTLEHERSKTTLSRRGVDLEVEDQAPVAAPADGIVRYAGAIRGLDHGVILDHGTYLSVIAKLGEVALPVGAKVARGDRLGHAARHRVYVEIRVKVGAGGLPVDPEPLFVKSR